MEMDEREREEMVRMMLIAIWKKASEIQAGHQMQNK